jgi:flagellar L-ring protein precursor FlgH
MAAVFLTSCTSVPDSIVHRPAAPRATAIAPAPAINGAIFQAGPYRPQFEDRRTRHVGDVLVVVINKKTSSGKTGNDTTSKSGRAGFSVSKLLGKNTGGGRRGDDRPAVGICVRIMVAMICLRKG